MTPGLTPALADEPQVLDRLAQCMSFTMWRKDGVDFGPWEELSESERDIFRAGARETIYELCAIISPGDSSPTSAPTATK